MTTEQPPKTPVKTKIKLTKELRELLNVLENTQENIFLSGKAGTGKSTFLRYFRSITKKNVVVLAPTGIAAVGIQGQTIHSFFKFGIDTTLHDIEPIAKNAIYKKIDLLVIDEISMVRSDLFDCMEKFMRLNGKDKHLPFGGVQLLVIGDLHQLPPVVKRNGEENIFTELYEGPHFFDAMSYKSAEFKKMELTHVFRQNQKHFIEALDAIRLNKYTRKHLQLINDRVVKNNDHELDFTISIVTTNKTAEEINKKKLDSLNTKKKVFKGAIQGKFKETLPTDESLGLKCGAQVMLIKNDPEGRFVNGDIGKIKSLTDSEVEVVFESGKCVSVSAETWNNINFKLDSTKRKIETETVGSFTQIPIKLAWAITIHKAQGKTFDKVHIDMGRGAFDSGQTYVALSRSRTLEGITLKQPIYPRDIYTNARVDAFMNNKE